MGVESVPSRRTARRFFWSGFSYKKRGGNTKGAHESATQALGQAEACIHGEDCRHLDEGAQAILPRELLVGVAQGSKCDSFSGGKACVTSTLAFRGSLASYFFAGDLWVWLAAEVFFFS